jgi:hypothetical protein
MKEYLEKILRVTGDGSIPDEWNGSTGGSGHAVCRRIAQEALAKLEEQTQPEVAREYDKNFGDDRECKCGHPYYRHFDTYDDMVPCGCKYCGCNDFKENVKSEGAFPICSWCNRSIEKGEDEPDRVDDDGAPMCESCHMEEVTAWLKKRCGQEV